MFHQSIQYIWYDIETEQAKLIHKLPDGQSFSEFGGLNLKRSSEFEVDAKIFEYDVPGDQIIYLVVIVPEVDHQAKKPTVELALSAVFEKNRSRKKLQQKNTLTDVLDEIAQTSKLLK